MKPLYLAAVLALAAMGAPRGQTINPALPLHDVAVLASTGVAVPLTGSTSETTLATFTVPANAMGQNGSVRVTFLGSGTNSANNKVWRVKFGSMTAAGNTVTTSPEIKSQVTIINRGATNSQVAQPTTLNGGYGTSSAAIVTGSVDTTADVTLTVTGQLALGTETMTLEYATVEILR